MKEVLEIIAKSLVDYPEQVDVKEINNEDQTVTLELRVAESDMGKVIGKQGRIAKRQSELLSKLPQVVKK